MIVRQRTTECTIQFRRVEVVFDDRNKYYMLRSCDLDGLYLGGDNKGDPVWFSRKADGWLWFTSEEAISFAQRHATTPDPLIPYDEIDQEEDPKDFPLFKDPTEAETA